MSARKVDIDYSHSQVTFSVRHMVVAKVHGRFDKWSGVLELDTDDLAKSSVEVHLDAASISTQEPNRDAHLRSPDFLDAEHHPQLDFRSKRVERVSDDRLRVIGDLTIRGVTHEVALDTELLGSAKDPWGNQRIAFSATTSIKRGDWGLKWNQVLEAGGVLVAEKIDITLDLQAVLQSAAQKVA
jgi:polyisoprenoid-binding protein YceI